MEENEVGRRVVIVSDRVRYGLVAEVAKTPSLGFPLRRRRGTAVADHLPSPCPFPGVGWQRAGSASRRWLRTVMVANVTPT